MGFTRDLRRSTRYRWISPGTSTRSGTRGKRPHPSVVPTPTVQPRSASATECFDTVVMGDGEGSKQSLAQLEADASGDELTAAVNDYKKWELNWQSASTTPDRHGVVSVPTSPGGQGTSARLVHGGCPLLAATSVGGTTRALLPAVSVRVALMAVAAEMDVLYLADRYGIGAITRRSNDEVKPC